MWKYRKIPAVIEAVQWNSSISEIENFIGNSVFIENGKIIIPTLEGPHMASPGDWIIKGIRGEFYPCKPDIFEQTYEKVD